MLFLLRFMAMKAAVSSPLLHPEAYGPPALLPGLRGSTLVTTAPMSARTWQQNGPAITCGGPEPSASQVATLHSNPPSSGGLRVRLRIAAAPRVGTSSPAHGAYAAY